jgi:hypothetical protein
MRLSEKVPQFSMINVGVHIERRRSVRCSGVSRS